MPLSSKTAARAARFAGGAALAALALLAGGCEKLPNIPPSASFIFSPVSPIFAGETAVVFNASASRDSDGKIVSYTWNFGDGTPEQTESGPTVVHRFPGGGSGCGDATYAVLLTVMDDTGAPGTASLNVNVTCR